MEDFIKTLEYICIRFNEIGISAKISGESIGSFVVAGDDGGRGAEIYPDTDQEKWVLDPAQNEELLGEVEFSTFMEATIAGIDWINSGKKIMDGNYMIATRQAFQNVIAKVPDVKPDEHDRV